MLPAPTYADAPPPAKSWRVVSLLPSTNLHDTSLSLPRRSWLLLQAPSPAGPEPAPHQPSATTWNKVLSQKQEDWLFNIPTMTERRERSTVKRSTDNNSSNNNNNTSWLSQNTQTSSHPGKALHALLAAKETLQLSVEGLPWQSSG